MVSLREYIVSTFPTADSKAINRILNQFDLLGIYEPSDIKYVGNEKELPELKPIEARKLLEKVRAGMYPRSYYAMFSNLLSVRLGFGYDITLIRFVLGHGIELVCFGLGHDD